MAANGASNVPVAWLAHHVPGRLRMKLPDAAGDDELLDGLQQWLAALPEVTAARFNALAACVVVDYLPDTPDFPVRLREAAAAAGRFELELSARAQPSEPAPSPRRRQRVHDRSLVAEVLMAQSHQADDRVREACGGVVDLKTLLPLLAGLASVKSSRSQAGTPAWMTLAIFAFNTFVSLHELARRPLPAASPRPAQVRPSVTDLEGP